MRLERLNLGRKILCVMSQKAIFKKPFLFSGPFISKREKHLLSNSTTISKAREDFLRNKKSNLSFLLEKRYSWMNDYIGKEDKGIEVGCGTGLSKLYINSKNLILTDIEAHAWVEKKVDALNMPFGDSSLDYIISSNMIHHLALPHIFFHECSRVLGKGGKLIIQDVNLSLLLRILIRITKNEGYFYDMDVFDKNTVCNNPKDPWSSNNAIVNLLFDDKDAFEKCFPFKIMHNRYTECLVWPLSGGVASVVKTINLPRLVLEFVDKLDELLISLSKSTFALQRQIVLANVK